MTAGDRAQIGILQGIVDMCGIDNCDKFQHKQCCQDWQQRSYPSDSSVSFALAFDSCSNMGCSARTLLLLISL